MSAGTMVLDARAERARGDAWRRVAAREQDARITAESALHALRAAVVEFWGPPETIRDIATRSPAQQRLLDALERAALAATEARP